jgi:hypothetical protein
MADENKPAFYPRVGNIKSKNFRPAQPAPFVNDPRAMELPQFGENSDQFGKVDVSIPNQQNRELGRRMTERDADYKRQQIADMSPLEKAAGALQAVRFMGSALTQAINSLPTRIAKGDAAAEKFIEDRIYKPEQPMAYEYAQDIGDFLDKLETQYKLPPILPEAVALQYLTGPATAQAARSAGKGAVKAGMALERGMEPVVKGALERGGLPREMALGMGQGTQSNVVKPKGGNWMAGSVEKVLDPLIQKGIINNVNIPYGPEFDAAALKRIEELKLAASQPNYTGGAGRVAEHLERDINNPRRANEAALNKWIQSNLTNYVKKDMGTPDDPVRKLADEGISHLPTDAGMPLNMGAVRETRKEAGFPDPYGQSWQGLLYESKADKPIGFGTAGEMINRGKGEPWMEKVDPFTKVYGISPMDSVNFTQDLGFNHIVDVLRQDVASGRIRPEQLNKVSMEQAVRRTYEYDQEMAKKMRETAIKQQEGFPTYKEYPEGYKWIELNQPKDLPEGWKESAVVGTYYDEAGNFQRHPREKIIEDALKYEGETMGHCVGGYCPDVLEGKSKIYSLRDAKGEPHVTIEVQPAKYAPRHDQVLQYKSAAEQEAKQLPNGYTDSDVYDIATRMAKENMPDQIVQIKGKGNAKPKDAYLPFVQDFVRGQNWTDVRDFNNTGFDWRTTGPQGIFMQDDVKALEQAGNKVPRYLTTPERDDLVRKLYELQTGKNYDTGLPKEPPTPDIPPDVLPDVPPDLEGLKRGGVVISNNPDTMMLELNNQKMAGGGAIAKLMRAAPKSKAEIDAIARRMAPQMLGEFVRGRTGSQSVAEKTQKQFAREKEMVHDIRPTGAERGLPRTVDIEELKDNVMVGIAGDPTISGKTIYSVNGVPLESPSPQYGGPLYGLEHEGDAFWASGLGAANRVQNIAREASKQYDLPVLGNYVMMGPDSINYAQHYADANLAAINPSKMSRGQIEDFNKLVRLGSKKSGPRPSFPGIENPSEAYLHFSVDPELRKHFNALMQMPTVTQKYNLPSGVDIRHAVTEPDLRDLEIGVTGKSIGRLRPEIEDLGYSEHPTYSHDIPGEFLGSTKYNIPYELSFPDSVKAVRENPKQAPQEFGSFKYVGPRQVIDQQLIDEIKQYQEMIKKYTGKKKGGAVKQPAAYIDGSEFVEAAQKYGIKDSMSNLNMIVNLVNKGLSVDGAARQVSDSGMHKAAGGAVSGDDLILEERPL